MIVDYDSLKTAVANWLARADLTSAIPEFIQLAESRINRSLYVRERMETVEGTSSDGVIPVPGDLDRLIGLRVLYDSQMRLLHPVSPGRDTEAVGSPMSYTVVGSDIRLIGTDDTDYALDYYARIPALNSTTTQNWLILKDPSLYLYGALLEAAPYLRNDDRASLWAQQFRAALDDLLMADEKSRFGSSPAPMVDFNAP